MLAQDNPSFYDTLAVYADCILQLLEHMILSRLLHVRIQVSERAPRGLRGWKMSPSHR